MLYNFDKFHENNKLHFASSLKPNDVIRRLDKIYDWQYYKVCSLSKHYIKYCDIEEKVIDANRNGVIFKVALSSRCLPTTREMSINRMSELQVMDAEEAMCIREPTYNDKFWMWFKEQQVNNVKTTPVQHKNCMMVKLCNNKKQQQTIK